MSRVLNLGTEPIGDAVYIGRRSARRGLAGSDFANPFRIGHDGTREQVIEQYRRWLIKQPHLLRRLGELRGRRLACWCSPLHCHGDVLVEFVDAYELLEDLAAAGISVTVVGSKIRLAPRSAVLDVLVVRAKQLKPAVLPLLALRQAEKTPPERHPMVEHAIRVFDAKIVKIARPAKQLA